MLVLSQNTQDPNKILTTPWRSFLEVTSSSSHAPRGNSAPAPRPWPPTRRSAEKSFLGQQNLCEQCYFLLVVLFFWFERFLLFVVFKCLEIPHLWLIKIKPGCGAGFEKCQGDLFFFIYIYFILIFVSRRGLK